MKIEFSRQILEKCLNINLLEPNFSVRTDRQKVKRTEKQQTRWSQLFLLAKLWTAPKRTRCVKTTFVRLSIHPSSLPLSSDSVSATELFVGFHENWYNSLQKESQCIYFREIWYNSYLQTVAMHTLVSWNLI